MNRKSRRKQSWLGVSEKNYRNSEWAVLIGIQIGYSLNSE